MKLKDVLKEIPAVMEGASPDTEINGICYDSRKARPGDLFVAVRGYESDGHRFIPAARAAGCAAVLCQERPEEEGPWVCTPDSRLALALAARNFYGSPASEMQVVGITGTNGKTTTAVLVKQMLETCLGAKVGLVGSVCNMIGEEELHAEHTTPESSDLQALFRRMADAGCRYCVMEVSSHSLVLHRVAGVEFAVGVFTNLSQDHLDFHGTMEEYAKAKAKLFRQCRQAAANMDDPWYSQVLGEAACPVLTYSATSDRAGLSARDIRLSADGVRFCALEESGLERVFLGLPGQFSVYNALAAIACGRLLGLSLRECAGALATARGAKGRVEPVPTDGDYNIFIDYAVTPDAMENVLTTLRGVTRGRLVILFGCGGDRDRKKRPLMGEIACRLTDYVVVTSDNPRTEEPMAIIQEILAGMEKSRTPRKVIENRPEAIRWAIENHRPGDVILLCGKGHEDYQIIGKEKIHMDEREIVAQVLAERAAGGRGK